MSDLIGYAPGAYDLFHVGHLNLLRLAKAHCDVLVAGVVSDEICVRTKGTRPLIPLEERLEIVRSIDIVDAVHAETTADRCDAWRAIGFQRIFKGSDWEGSEKGVALERLLRPMGVEVVYLPYTMHTSSTLLRRAVAARHATTASNPVHASVAAAS